MLSNTDTRNQHTRLYLLAYILFKSEKKFLTIPVEDYRSKKGRGRLGPFSCLNKIKIFFIEINSDVDPDHILRANFETG